MAQTKLQKQAKALEYWERKFGTLHLKSFDRDNPVYILSQIDILTHKLDASGQYRHRYCALCGHGFIQWEVDQFICIRCSSSFRGVMMQIKTLGNAFNEVGMATAAASRAAQSIATMFMNTPYKG